MEKTLFRKSSLIWATLFLLMAVMTVAESGAAPLPGGSLDPTTIPKYGEKLPIPQVMPNTGTANDYAIAARKFQQQILPRRFPPTTVFGYGSAADPIGQETTFSYPARTIEATKDTAVRVKWVNQLVNPDGTYVSHFIPIDQTLHWANPPRECKDVLNANGTDCRGLSQDRYTGPVPIVTHLHGAHVGPVSDGYPEAWWLPDANIPDGYAPTGSNYDSVEQAGPGAAVFQYTNDQRATTLWYHDHVLGMTRANVYAGLAGFYIIRDPATDPTDLPKGKYEIPLLIQDKSFNSDGSLFFPDNRAFFEGLNPYPVAPYLNIPFIGDPIKTYSDVSPIWNPEFFGNVMLVNGRTWPVLKADANRYRLRILNGDDTRVLILKIVAGDPTLRPGVPVVPFWQIGADGGFLPSPAMQKELLVAPAERADVIVDLSSFAGTDLYLINEGPDEPFGGGRAPADFGFADPGTTGQVMKISVGAAKNEASTPPDQLALPYRLPLGDASFIRTVSLNEEESQTVFVTTLADGSVVESTSRKAVPFGPTEALLGTATVVNGVITPTPREWMEPITESPTLGLDGTVTETWEIYDFTEDAHPIHIHQVQFEVVNRQAIRIGSNGTARLSGNPVPPEAGETGTKDTVLVYPGMVTRVKAHFDIPGLFVWHCHILSHEDNEMMRPMCVGGGCTP